MSIETENGRVKGVVTQLNGEYSAKCVVIATGTNLGGKIFVGDAWYASGPDGMHAANALTDSLKAAGLPLRRSRPAPLPGCTAAASIFPSWNASPAIRTMSYSPSAL